MAPKPDLPDFNGFINKGRERRKDELLANKFLGKNRRASAPGATNINRKPGAGPSLASRMGVGKRGLATPKPAPRQNSTPTVGNVDAEWTHDLHSLNNPGSSRTSQNPPRGPKNINTRARNDRLAKAFNGSASTPDLNAQYNIVGKSKATKSMSIKGLAGPYIVMAENFARGTSAQDIETAMTPVGGPPLSCRLISDYPRIIAEIIFDTKDGADNVIDTFNNQEADGNLLNVYNKSGAPAPTLQPASQRSAPRLSVPTGPRASRVERSAGSDSYDSRYDSSRSSRDDIIDGSYGFDDRMDTDDRDGGSRTNARSQGLYSDNLVGGRAGNSSNRNGNNWNVGRGNDRNRSYR
ncbi:hypothetical protein BOTNAR_0016g00120 [Botryotinia narcissicola]|uniref:RRM domain-containing protein n=1 Tax=Botryotinia narcissicola TaxID=278944 RepID=A0A4Z1JJ59_9HELO|nr:hypothetical protein BOTNAR_0016g00120 [Botryotinia narcissicola]